MTLKEFYQELEKHDWYYDMSDDHGVWERGTANKRRLEGIAEESEEHRKLYEGFSQHYFSGEPWGTEKKPKPVLKEV